MENIRGSARCCALTRNSCRFRQKSATDFAVKRFPLCCHRHALLAILLAHGAGASCGRDEPELPPDDAPAAQSPEFDIEHFATSRADRSFTIANLVLVLQPDRVEGQSMGVTLSGAQPAVDGSRLVFGTFEKADSLEGLTRKDIDFGGVAIYDPRGNGIFTPRGAYQPKLATIRINTFDTNQASGTIRGQFHHFKPGQTTFRPSVVPIEANFYAKLIVK